MSNLQSPGSLAVQQCLLASIVFSEAPSSTSPSKAHLFCSLNAEKASVMIEILLLKGGPVAGLFADLTPIMGFQSFVCHIMEVKSSYWVLA